MKLSIGTAQFGFKYGLCNKVGIVSLKEVQKIIKFCKSKKIYSIDTAQGYGRSHKVLGSINLNKFQVTTKISSIKKASTKDLESYISLEINKILKDLNTNNLYGLLIHNTRQLEGKFGMEYYRILQKLKNEKKFIKLGVSVYTKKELDFILKNYNVDLVNLPMSIANQEFYDVDYLSKIKKKKIQIHVRSIFLQGLLFSNYSDLPLKFKNNKFFLEWFKWLKIYDIDKLEACLNFIKKVKYIDKIIIGIDSLDQLKMIEKVYKKNIKMKFKSFTQSLILRNPSKW